MEPMGDISYLAELTPTPIMNWCGGGKKMKEHITLIGVGVQFAQNDLAHRKDWLAKSCVH